MALSRQDLTSLLAALAIPQAAALVGGLATASSVRTWYPKLKKPGWNPPGAVFGSVWTVLYLLMGLASWLVWRGERANPSAQWPEDAPTQEALATYGGQLALNTLWSIICRSPQCDRLEDEPAWPHVLSV